ncbi:WXG100 family type VII secretion target [Streptomyces sp. JJ66]|nr:WXG100 family type VII secretion target [Streptomyces sp. JJ66]
MSGVNVTFEEMKKAEKKLKDKKDDLEKELDGLEKYVEGLVRDGFVTESASQAFDDSFKEFTRGAKKTVGGLEGMGDFLKGAADGLRQFDQDLARQMKG